MAGHKEHDYHIVNPSIWPLFGAVSAFIMLFGAAVWFNSVRNGAEGFVPWMFALGFVGVLITMFGWWRDVIKEANETTDHTPVVVIGLRYGFILFIISEVFFFLAWFWAYFRNALFPPNLEALGSKECYSVETAYQACYDSYAIQEAGVQAANAVGAFPPESVHIVDPWGLPLINTLILLLSGCTLTWAHHALLEAKKGAADYAEKRKHVVWGLAVTVALGVIFLGLQALEYVEGYHHHLTLQNSYYGSAFYMATGFHGMHVLIGTLFLIVCLFRAMRGDFSQERHVGFEAAAWYWHFVDVVWLFLFAMVYLGSAYFFHVGGAH